MEGAALSIPFTTASFLILSNSIRLEMKLALTVLQGLNAKLIEWDTDKKQRFEILQNTAQQWLTILNNSAAVKKLSNKLNKPKPPKLK